MTTDYLDQTSVEGAEAEVPATQLDTQPDSVQLDEANQGESQEQSEDLTPDASLDSFLKERGYDAETEGDSVQTEQEAKAPSPEVLAEAQRLAQEQRAAEDRKRWEEGVQKSFATRTTRLRTDLYNVMNGNQELTPALIEAVVGEFNSHHGQIAPVVEAETLGKAAQTFNNTLFQAMEKELPGISKGSYADTPSFTKAVVEAARKGYVPEKEVKTKVKAEVAEYKKFLEDKGLLKTSKAAPNDGGEASLPAKQDLNWSLNAPITDIIKARQSRA